MSGKISLDVRQGASLISGISKQAEPLPPTPEGCPLGKFTYLVILSASQGNVEISELFIT